MVATLICIVECVSHGAMLLLTGKVVSSRYEQAWISRRTLASAGLASNPLLARTPITAGTVNCGNLKATFGPHGVPVRIESGRAAAQRVWCAKTATVIVRNEVTNVSESPIDGQMKALDLMFGSKWSSSRFGLVWDLTFESSAKRAGYEVTIDLPALSRGMKVFTPTNDPEFAVSERPTYRPVTYGSEAWKTGSAYVLPLISLMDPTTDQALTVALPPNANIPHLQFEWIGGSVLRLTLGHRAMGAGKVSPLRLLFYAHAADYRSAIKAYSDEFPKYFEPPLPRGRAEGTFWYHHIQDHPDFAEMERQRVRYMWSSFWFQYLGDYMPESKEWPPYTYARWWKLGQLTSDEKINAFIAEMGRQEIGVYAYFNVTEYGGAGGADGGGEVPVRLLETRFADALAKDIHGREIATWEGARVVNPRQDGSIWPELKKQCEAHFKRLPDFQGFIIDRLDWSSKYDYGHDDGCWYYRRFPRREFG